MKRIFLSLSAIIFACTVKSQSWRLTGNSGTDPAIHFIGTTDLAPLRFRVQNIPGGEIDPTVFKTGFGSLSSAFPANYSTNFGHASLLNSSGSNNTAVGYNSCRAGSALSSNTGLGKGTLLNSISKHNTAAGASAGVGLLGRSAENNTSVGSFTLAHTLNARHNTVIGYYASINFNLSGDNILVGANSNGQRHNQYYMIAIGQGAICTDESTARIGNTATWSIGGYAGWTNFSDGRYKKDIQENVKGLEFIMRLRPVTYRLDISGAGKQLKESGDREWDEAMKTAIAEKEKMIYSGFVAQEVEQQAKATGYDFSGVDKPRNEQAFYGLRYSEFVVPLVKTLQEQQQIIQQLQARIAELDKLKSTK
jgi:trimeric autotransporter adhesin